jgi:hypothetical protein
MAKLTLAMLFLCLAIPARSQICGPAAKFDSKTVSTKAAVEDSPPTGKALVYVFSKGTAIAWDRMISLDREWIGILRTNNYFVAAVAPGKHDLCGVIPKSDTPATAVVELEAGKSYYFQFIQNLGYLATPSFSLSKISAEDAKVFLNKSKRRIFWPKGSLPLNE